jgi:hypothetical protein
MRASRSRSIVLLLDCCYGGAFSQGVAVRSTGKVNIAESFPAGRLGGGRGRAVITASNAMEYAFEGDRLADDQAMTPSVFTEALVEGLSTGDADRDEDGWVSLNELYDYVFDRVRERNPHQTPSRDVEMQGELYIARSTRRRVRPQQIPSDLRAAMNDANMFSRLGAVTELRVRLTSDNLPLAAGACEALQEIATNDIQYVADAAAVALRDVQTRTAESQLRFETVAGGIDPGTRTLRLLGPPLARVCTAQASDSRVTTAETPDGFEVSADTRAVGTYRADITIKGHCTETVVPVEVVVHAAPAAQPTPAPRPVPAAGPIPTPVPAAEPGPSRAAEPVPSRAAEPAPAPAKPAAGASPPPQPAVRPLTTAPQAPIPSSASVPPPTSVPQQSVSQRATVVGPYAVPTSSRTGAGPERSWWDAVVAYEMLAVGAFTVGLGLVLLALQDEQTQSRIVMVQIAVYAVHWIVSAAVPGDGRSVRRIPAGLLGAAAIVTLTWLVAEPPHYLSYWSIHDTPLYGFWIVAGLLEIAATIAGGESRIARPLEWVAAGWGLAFGVVLFSLVASQVDGSLGVAFALYSLGLGVVWVIAGLQRRGELIAPQGR